MHNVNFSNLFTVIAVCFNACMFGVVYACLFLTLFYDRPVGWCCFLYVFRQVKQNRVIAKLSLREYYFAIEVTLNGYTCNVFWLWGLKFWSIFMHSCLFVVLCLILLSSVFVLCQCCVSVLFYFICCSVLKFSSTPGSALLLFQFYVLLRIMLTDGIRD